MQVKDITRTTSRTVSHGMSTDKISCKTHVLQVRWGNPHCITIWLQKLHNLVTTITPTTKLTWTATFQRAPKLKVCLIWLSYGPRSHHEDIVFAGYWRPKQPIHGKVNFGAHRTPAMGKISTVPKWSSGSSRKGIRMRSAKAKRLSVWHMQGIK